MKNYDEFTSLNLDLSKLSPALRDKIVRGIDDAARTESFQIHQDVKHYAEGPVKEQMVGWEKAAADLSLSIAKLRHE